MRTKNLSISKQINIWLSSVFLIILILASASLFFIDAIWKNTSELYMHPLTVRRAVGALEADVLLIHNNMLQLGLGNSQQGIDEYVKKIDVYEADASRQLDIIYDRYLGQRSDIDKVSDALVQWKTIRNETIRLYRTGQVAEAQKRVDSKGIGGVQAEKVMNLTIVISDFALNKGDEFYLSAQEQRNSNVKLLVALVSGAFFVLIGIGYYLRKGIVPPIIELTAATEAMQQGKLDARIHSDLTNEIGLLSKAFNDMANTIEAEIIHKDTVLGLSSTMIEQDDLHQFCQELLKGLMLKTNSQMGAVYLKNETKKCFEPYESIGFKHENLASFSAFTMEGELGTALATETVQHLTEIPHDIQIVFSTVSGDYRAKEIITMPVINGNEVISVISLASIKSYVPSSVRLINGMQNEITARLSALLASQKIHEISQKLQNNNAELQQQAHELQLQAGELTEQNIELEMQKKQLSEASSLKTNFLSTMSHELRTPLNSVIALSGVLSRKLVNQIPNEEYSYLEIIERNGKTLLALINDVLDISRIEAGREEINLNKFVAKQAIDDIVAMIQPQAQQRNVTLLHETSESIIICSDVDKFRHILQNLIGNAVKFTEKGEVIVTSQKSESNIVIKVKDTGIGIAAEHIPFIFDEFRQADGSTSRRFGGAGLGLAISKKYANLIGGTISVESTLNKGSEFTLTLPLQCATEDRLSTPTETEDYRTESTRTQSNNDRDTSEKVILLVEDNDAAVIQIKDLIEELGLRVMIARDAVEAFALLKYTIPDAMILDLMMPGIDGFKVLETMRNAEPTARIPVLILTAKHIMKEELQMLKRNNIHQLIQKGDVKRLELQKSIMNMLFPETTKKEVNTSKIQAIKGKPLVLVVEDNPDNMITVKALLNDQYIVLEAINAYEGIEMARKHIPNLILMDIALPDISGIEAFRQIRAIPDLQNIPVIALTASAMIHDREAILSNGFDAFVAKPIIAQEFFAAIKEVLYGE